MRVLLTGAGGRTGQIVAKKLQAQPDVDLVATVRSEQSKASLIASGVPAEAIRIVDIVSGTAEALQAELAGCSALIILTSAVPVKLPQDAPGPPQFTFKEAEFPEQVDWKGQVLQIDAAKSAGVTHVVLVSSMGGTDPSHFLNSIGSGGIVNWKRKAEQYLIASGLQYTILHPGGLVDDTSTRGGVLLGVDDTLQRPNNLISREQLAEVAVQSLTTPAAINRSLDLGSEPSEGSGAVKIDLAELLAHMTANCDYSINNQMT